MAGKAAKKRQQDKRRASKRSLKEIKKRDWEAKMAKGTNSKSKATIRGHKRKFNPCTTVSHPTGKCGNIGCKRCQGEDFSPFLLKGKPNGMKPSMYMRWKTAA